MGVCKSICIWLSNVWGWPEPYIYGVCTVFLAGNHQKYGRIWCIYRFWPTLQMCNVTVFQIGETVVLVSVEFILPCVEVAAVKCRQRKGKRLKTQAEALNGLDGNSIQCCQN